MEENNKKPDVFNQKNTNESNNIDFSKHKSQNEINAQDEMAKKTAEQLAARDEVLRKLDEMGIKNANDKARYMQEMAPALVRTDLIDPELSKPRGSIIYDNDESEVGEVKIQSSADINEMFIEEEANIDKNIIEYFDVLAQPQFDTLFDIVPLASQGKLYGLRDKTLKVSFLNASDENILTNPNIIQSGRFLEILMNRKILDTRVRYHDLSLGDRDCIMIWLRYTAFGDKYPISVMDPKTKEYFDTEIELSKLKIKKLKLNPNKYGYFEFKLPLTNDLLEFKFINVLDYENLLIDEEEIIQTKGGEFVNRTTAYLYKQIISVNGDKRPEVLKSYIDTMRLGDVRAFRKHVLDNEHGVDMNLTVRTPGGESVNTFLPINGEFFWPEQ